MEGVSCPQCGNPNLDVDAQNNVVFCKNCGFAVQVDPQTGNVTPLSQGGGAGAQAPEAYASAPTSFHGQKTILGTDPLTFFLIGLAAVGFLFFTAAIDDLTAAILGAVVFLAYWYGK